jgi:hypothetical protein
MATRTFNYSAASPFFTGCVRNDFTHSFSLGLLYRRLGTELACVVHSAFVLSLPSSIRTCIYPSLAFGLSAVGLLSPFFVCTPSLCLVIVTSRLSAVLCSSTSVLYLLFVNWFGLGGIYHVFFVLFCAALVGDGISNLGLASPGGLGLADSDLSGSYGDGVKAAREVCVNTREISWTFRFR